jgi:hypothetical protein
MAAEASNNNIKSTSNFTKKEDVLWRFQPVEIFAMRK